MVIFISLAAGAPDNLITIILVVVLITQNYLVSKARPAITENEKKISKFIFFVSLALIIATYAVY